MVTIFYDHSIPVWDGLRKTGSTFCRVLTGSYYNSNVSEVFASYNLYEIDLSERRFKTNFEEYRDRFSPNINLEDFQGILKKIQAIEDVIFLRYKRVSSKLPKLCLSDEDCEREAISFSVAVIESCSLHALRGLAHIEVSLLLHNIAQESRGIVFLADEEALKHMSKKECKAVRDFYFKSDREKYNSQYFARVMFKVDKYQKYFSTQPDFVKAKYYEAAYELSDKKRLRGFSMTAFMVKLRKEIKLDCNILTKYLKETFSNILVITLQNERDHLIRFLKNELQKNLY